MDAPFLFGTSVKQRAVIGFSWWWLLCVSTRGAHRVKAKLPGLSGMKGTGGAVHGRFRIVQAIGTNVVRPTVSTYVAGGCQGPRCTRVARAWHSIMPCVHIHPDKTKNAIEYRQNRALYIVLHMERVCAQLRRGNCQVLQLGRGSTVHNEIGDTLTVVRRQSKEPMLSHGDDSTRRQRCL